MMHKEYNVKNILLIFALVFCISGACPVVSFAEGVYLPAGGVVADDIPGAIGGLSTAKNFHIFSNQAELSVHTSGNIATGNLIGAVNFGTDVRSGGVLKDIHYLRSVTQIASSSFVASTSSRGLKVVFGAEVKLSWVDNGNKLAVDETILSNVKKAVKLSSTRTGKHISILRQFLKSCKSTLTLLRATLKQKALISISTIKITVSLMSPMRRRVL